VLQSDLSGDKNDMRNFDFDNANAAGLEEIEEWRPLSPGPYDEFDRYDEEY